MRKFIRVHITHNTEHRTHNILFYIPCFILQEKQGIKKDKKEGKKKVEKIKKAEKKPEIKEPVAKKQSGLIGKEKIKKEASEAYKVLRKPWITEKATDSASQNKYIFKIFPGVNKTEIKKTVEKLDSTGC